MKLSSYGFSLVELLVGGAILAGIGLTAAQLIKGQKTTQARIDHDLELDLIHDRISDMFAENAKDCDATFAPIRTSDLTATAISAIRKCTHATLCRSEQTAGTTPTNSPIVFSTGMGAPDLSPRSLWYIESFGALRPHNGVTQMRTNLMVMPVNYAHKKQNRRITKFVTIAMRFNNSGQFVQCLDANSSNIHNVNRDLCNTLRAVSSGGAVVRGVWNGETNSCNTTGIITNCAPGTVFDGIAGTNGVSNGCIPTDRIMTKPIKNHPWLPDPRIDSTRPTCSVRTNHVLRVRLSKSSYNRITFVCQ